MNHYTDEARVGGLITWKHIFIPIIIILIIAILQMVI